MKILVVSNLYPPHHVGGYELGCRDVVHALRSRGHEVHVLTSTFRFEGIAEEEEGVERTLRYVPVVGQEPHDKVRECRLLIRVAKRHGAEIVYFWNQAGLCYWLPIVARWLGWSVAFYISDGDFVSWRVGAWLSGAAAKNSLLHSIFGGTFLVRGKSIVDHETCHFASEFLRTCATRAGIAVAPETSCVAHWGIDSKLFVHDDRRNWPPRRLLYVGQLIPQKGVHTAIAALGLLAGEAGYSELTLTICGGGMDSEYEKGLRAMPGQLGISDRVKFSGKVARKDLPLIYAEHDILVFPSEWEEPFAITPLEAMASGVVVVGTKTGGSGELFRDRETAMTFATGDAEDCARAVRYLVHDPGLYEILSRRGQEEVLTHHTLESMVVQIEEGLERVVRTPIFPHSASATPRATVSTLG